MRNPIDILFGVKALLTKRRVVRNVFHSPPTWPKALLQYKTDPLFNPRLATRYSHTNNWEIIEICRILHCAGFWIDVVDRQECDWSPDDEYALFIGNASGRAGWRFTHYADRVPSARRILYATSPQADLAASLMRARYEAFESRTGICAPRMRIPYNIDIQSIVTSSDAIFCFDANGFALESYRKFGLPLYPIVPSTSPKVMFQQTWLASRRRKAFLCFAGDGFVVKGVDLVVEAFSTMSDLSLYIAGPRSDFGFWEAYGNVIASSPNISYEGFVGVSDRRFRDLCGECSYVILPSSSEAACTSVATAMRAGLVPITTRATAVDDGSAGYILASGANELIDAIRETAFALSRTGIDDYSNRVRATLRASAAFSQAGFSVALSDALYGTLMSEDPVGLRGA